ncbi:GSCFA domain-containing protein [Cytophaga sp. FL35]|uniref:GSCFA domain-containing protein n=1 Tax=Cytophaga sp. FL35 TaxID=1904456 RepID=UPI0016537B9F|nr:GSCFA domain-containing protein [Cytophaga sp. FL35]MBC6999446.1 GSCFA domain-containing protein [Cytophaga sp. FL35]
MKLQTQIPLKKADVPIDYQSQILLLGSCFSENMGEKMAYHQFQHLRNPLGILFHPLAIENLLNRAKNLVSFLPDELFEHNGLWHSYEAHSSLDSENMKEVLGQLNTAVKETNDFLKTASHLILTFGTAWVYRHKESGKVVANCHKVPQRAFDKELLSVAEIVQSLENCIRLVQEANPAVEVILTISPVRHLKDGFVENQRSKSHLITAVHEVISKNAGGYSGVSYFPSYEIQMDELRDYRFYKEDMVHPNALAVSYIWEKFKEVWMAQDVHKIMDEVAQIQRGLAHRPFQPLSQEHLKFKEKLHEKIARLQERFPFMDFA